MTTHFETTKDAAANRKWVVVDAKGKIVGRLASQIAHILRGKANPKFTPHEDTGDFVVVINAELIKFSGEKISKKEYKYHTGYVGGLKTKPAGEVMASKPEEILKGAVQGMLPKTPLGRRQLKKLKIYRGANHRHSAQNPKLISL